MQVDILSMDDPRWPEALAGLRHDVYHRPGYVRLDARRLDAGAEAFLIRDGERLLFLPYLLRPCPVQAADPQCSVCDVISPYGYPGILVNDAGRHAEFAAAAMQALKQTWAGRGVCSAFLRMHPILGANHQNLFPEGTFSEPSETVAIDLNLDEAALWKQLRPGHQDTIKKCQKLGFAARFVPLGDVLEEFVVIYAQTMDRVKAKDTYYFSHDYFAELAKLPEVICGIVEKDSTSAAACVFFECGGIVQAHLGGTHSNFLSRSPFHLVLHQAALSSKARGQRWLHLGGGLGGSNDTLLHFKSGFSPIRFRYHTIRLITDDNNYRRLVASQAQSLNLPPENLLTSNFFPAYRYETSGHGNAS